MPFDGFVLAAVAAELKKKIIFGRIMKIYQPQPNLIVLRIRKEKDNLQLLISAHPVTGRIHLSQETRENPLKAPLFCMVLRKHLEGGRITGIEQEGLERVLKIRVEAVDEIGEKSEKFLIGEIMGKHSNIILVDPKQNEILDGIRRYTHLVSRHREVLPGRPYLPPPSQNKKNPLEIDEDNFRVQLLDTSLSTKLSNALVKNFSGFSPLLAREVVTRAQLPENITIDSMGDYDFIKCWQAFQEIIEGIKTGIYRPTIAGNERELWDFSFVPLFQYDSSQLQEFPEMSQALDFFYSQREQQELFSSRQRELEKVIKQEIDRLTKKISLQEEKKKETDNGETFRVYGELITAYMYLLKKGMVKAELENFNQAGTKLEVPLDPRLTPAENAQVYFKKYNKAKSAKVLVEEQIKKGRSEMAYLESVLASLEQAVNLADLNEIRIELAETGYLKEKHQPRKKSAEPVLPPLSFVTPDGYTILVGKNNKQNDRLTLKTAGKDDMWLHTKNIPGSHVIIRKKPGADIPFSTIETAAKLAAFYSKARYSSQVPVDYTLVRQVKKPAGAKPGMVIYFEQKTIYVTPEDIPSKQ
ncbi:MAG: Rqc2 family fibronectin-binding protein [Bacillota bacterium]|jgi:predicted ribosome quality control (RQC) complex YloA/Tae2 family protein